MSNYRSMQVKLTLYRVLGFLFVWYDKVRDYKRNGSMIMRLYTKTRSRATFTWILMHARLNFVEPDLKQPWAHSIPIELSLRFHKTSKMIRKDKNEFDYEMDPRLSNNAPTTAKSYNILKHATI